MSTGPFLIDLHGATEFAGKLFHRFAQFGVAIERLAESHDPMQGKIVIRQADIDRAAKKLAKIRTAEAVSLLVEPVNNHLKTAGVEAEMIQKLNRPAGEVQTGQLRSGDEKSPIGLGKR